jgi:hypothetical protein
VSGWRSRYLYFVALLHMHRWGSVLKQLVRELFPVARRSPKHPTSFPDFKRDELRILTSLDIVHQHCATG